ncbi:C2 domain containing protein [Trichomonas vaginalis G3]|uniref:C2 domain containing protein n=1 Tax=Trichomonas vaginalis (strain ATCC PRA-98 / G3) TaxID=412133 RepID=A2F227_TRIV3|nr:C2 domain-containing protein family [Trichomonas vaginalis G3]EAY01026.1 C2 domain containing protein [Trichomonas vaginalis G3]KAI5488621.1 C2 domain-containing protein family [Trichomonas vaginalis G3]|eukprot:XP_001313912.1 C2 domain containing protein [Trichomonas vaginalis G3]
MFHFRIISCKDLPIKDADGKIDSYVILETKGKDNKPRKRGKTKVVPNNLNPVYPEEIFDVPADDCYTVKFTVMDEDVFKDDTACWIKIKVSSLISRLGDKLTKEMLVKNPENHPGVHSMITFIVTLDGELASDHPGKAYLPRAKPALEMPHTRRAEIILIGTMPDQNLYDFDILVVQP